MGTTKSRINEPLANVLFGVTRQAVLRLLFGHVERRFYQRQIVREVGLGSGTVQRELKALTDSGILRRSMEGSQTYFQVNPDCPIYPELRSLIRKTFGLTEVLRAALAHLESEIRVAFVFGSVSKSRENAASEIDVMVIGDSVKPRDVNAAIRPVEDQLKREVNVKVFHSAEFRHKLAAKQQFVTRVMEGPKIFLIGDDRDLARLAKERLA